MAKNIAKKSAETCRKIRLAYLYQRSEFAKLLGVNPHSIHMYESGRRTPKLPTIRSYIELAAAKKIKLGLENFQD